MLDVILFVDDENSCYTISKLFKNSYASFENIFPQNHVENRSKIFGPLKLLKTKNPIDKLGKIGLDCHIPI